MLDRTADAAGDVEVGRDPGAGLADLLVVRSPAGGGDHPRDAERAAEQLGQLQEVAESVGAAGPATGADHDPGGLEAAALVGLELLDRHDAGDQVGSAAISGRVLDDVGGPGVSAGVASTAWPATVKTAGRSSRTISSRAAPPTTWRVTLNGDSPLKDSTLAAIATPARAATWAITSVPRSVPPAITTTDFDRRAR